MPLVNEEHPRKQKSPLGLLLALLALVALVVLLVPAVYPLVFVTGSVRWVIRAFYSREPAPIPQGFTRSPSIAPWAQVWTLRLGDGYYMVIQEDLTRGKY